ncbi:N-acetylmuramoyl-L-alanine amidase [Patescibacteria group bacterium]|nr:N-acetylmuramoyl-L-alanine amidase [Patescibacteria group bacterium]
MNSARIPYQFRKKQRAARRKLLILGLCAILVGLGAVTAYRNHSKQSGLAAGLNLLHSVGSSVKSVSADTGSCPGAVGSSPKVGIQAGHWQTDQMPDELSSLRWDFGASSGGVNEVDVNLDVAKKTVAILQKDGISVDLLPATVPPGYCANAFVAIHADGNDVTSVYGYKTAGSYWDASDKSLTLSDDINQDYGQVTGMNQNPAITDNMDQYYAFNFQKFNHAIAPQTPGAIIELGFVSNPTDQAILTGDSQLLAQGVAQGVVDFLNGKVAPTPTPTDNSN